MTAFKVIGHWLDESCLTTAIFKAGIATSGVADLLLKATHVTRTMHAHQITAAALSILQHYTSGRDFIEFNRLMCQDVNKATTVKILVRCA